MIDDYDHVFMVVTRGSSLIVAFIGVIIEEAGVEEVDTSNQT